jgi:exodeoxyribonuclease V alpha subunit
VSLTVEDRDPFEARLAVHASGLLAQFNQAGVLAAADVHVARRLASLVAEREPSVLLAIALAVRAPRLGHVLVDLAAIRATAAVDAEQAVDLETLAWPQPPAWIASVTASALVAVGDEAADAARPLRLVGSWLYLDRYWAEEVQVAASLTAMGADEAPVFDLRRLGDGLARMFGSDLGGRQSLAAASAVLRRFAVVAGGPGTGKTTTVARIVALLCEQAAAAGCAPPLIALAAPTGKAAARLQEAVHAEAAQLEVDGAIADQLLALQAGTLHRLLGWRPASNSRFRHHRNQQLPHDVVIVDETSMVSLSLMARLIEALRSDARLVLVGDPGQLASIEAGAVLGDIVGPAADGPRIGAAARRRLSVATGHPVELAGPTAATGAVGAVGDGIVVLDRVHRFGGGIAGLASAIRGGDGDAVVALLRDPPDDVRWIEVDLALSADDGALQPIRERALHNARTVIEAARTGSAAAALERLAAFRILCAHRRGPYGVATWTANMESWLEAELEGFAVEDRWYVGRPLLVNENDYELRLNNGDTGVVLRGDEGRVVAAFQRGAETIQYSPSRLSAVETVYAMTIHKGQGSQFDTAAVLLPGPDSRILTRELLYTAATRARRELILAGTEEAVRAAVRRPVARASGLRRRLWQD